MGYYVQMSSCLVSPPCALKRNNNNNNAEQRCKKKKDTDWENEACFGMRIGTLVYFVSEPNVSIFSEAVMLV